MGRRGSGGATWSGPHAPGMSTRRDPRSVAPRTPRGVGEPGRAVAPECENRLDGSAACPPITRGFSPPGYNLVLVGCRHPSEVPRAFGDSAQFVGLAQYAVVSVASAASQVDAGCQPGTRLPTTATTATAGLGVRVDPDWVACPPTRPAGHTPAETMRTVGTGSVSPIQAPPPCFPAPQ
jgi:hypothetical protein